MISCASHNSGMQFTSIDKIIFQGNQSLSPQELEAVLYSKSGEIYSSFTSRENVKAIVEHYRQMGFLQAEVTQSSDTIGENGYILLYTIKEGSRSTINSITIIAPDIKVDLSMFAKHQILPGQPLNQYNLSMALYILASKYINKGYYHTEIFDSLIALDHDSIAFDIIIEVNPGNQVYIQTVEIRGNQKVREQVIQRELNFAPGDLFYPALLDVAKTRLYYTSLFSYISLRPLLSKTDQDSVRIIITVNESKPSYISAGISYRTNQQAGINLQWGNNNIFGNAQKVDIRASYTFDFSGNYLIDAGIGYYEPYFFNSGFMASTNINGQRQGGQQLSANYIEIVQAFGRKLSRFGTAYLAYKYHIAWLDTSFQNQVFNEKYTNSILFNYVYDSRDNPFYPSKGFYQDLGVEFAGGILNGNNNFIRPSVKWARIDNISSWGGYLLVKGIYTHPYGSTVEQGVTPDQKLHLGGVNSLRGYPENSIGDVDEIGEHSGNILINFMSEAHFKYNIISFCVFLDGGGLWNEYAEVSTNTNTQLGFGAGINFETPAGPIRFEYGKSLTEFNRQGIFHFALGYPF